jgi:hypothetical protein
MIYANLLAEAWEITRRTPKLTWFIFFPSLAGVFVFLVEAVWQYYVLATEFGNVDPSSGWAYLQITVDFIMESGMVGWTIFAALFVLFFNFLIPTWVQASLILSVKHRGDTPEAKFSIRRKIIEGFDYFVPLLELRGALLVFDFMTVGFTVLSFYRYTHDQPLWSMLVPLIITYSIVAVIVQVFVSFSAFYIVHENCSFSRAIKKSVSLVFMHFVETLWLVLMMALVNLRVIVNAVVVLGVPSGLIFLATYLSGSDWQEVFMTIAIIVSFILIAASAYLTAVLEVFSTSFWERSFSHFIQEQDS